MAITQAFCIAAKQAFLDGVHASTDTYKLALFTSSASLSEDTTTYSATGEASGDGYTPGGATLSGRTSGLVSGKSYLTWSNVVFTNATFVARGGLIYNASKSGAAIAVVDFGADYSVTNGTFTVVMPTAGALTTIRIE